MKDVILFLGGWFFIGAVIVYILCRRICKAKQRENLDKKEF